MVDIRFQEEKNLEINQIDVLISSQDLTPRVKQLMDYIRLYEEEAPRILPIKTLDRIEMLKVKELVSLDVEGTRLILDTLKGRQVTTERLYKFQERLNNPDFIQVSKHGVININHLEALEASFSGNMLAILTGKRKVDVSRRYLKNLEKRLGL
ncbi:LytTr family transcriptional regulator [Streptococcus varani]|jgi:DNA-binding LytR/AlgR family response regulator|uniref:LytTr family transcriptional regulator n=1 Tax=Streptococcus varani TaxID=1608583 RepID=A0A0E4H3P8_9STRE|nr:LytTr family transcriptional regulator [Streptococcus varani]